MFVLHITVFSPPKSGLRLRPGIAGGPHSMGDPVADVSSRAPWRADLRQDWQGVVVAGETRHPGDMNNEKQRCTVCFTSTLPKAPKIPGPGACWSTLVDGVVFRGS